MPLKLWYEMKSEGFKI